MSRISIIRNKVRLRALLGIRARLVVLALILVSPLMFDRIRSLEEARIKQVAELSSELAKLAQRAADAQREVISSVEAVLKSTAYIHAAASHIGKGCAILRASMRVDLPSIRMIAVADADGVIRCSTSSIFVGGNVKDRAYFKKALETHDFVVSDFLVGRQTKTGTILAAYPVSAVAGGEDAVVIAGMNLDWMSGVMGDLAGRTGVTAALVDSEGVILATPPGQSSLIGTSIETLGLAPALINNVPGSRTAMVVRSDGRLVSFARIPGTKTRLVVSIDEAKVSAAINHEIRTAYLQLAMACLVVLLGALVAAERLIVRPIGILTATATKFGQGDWSARATRSGLPAEFVPLAKAFNAMARKLGERERELVASNNQLTVMASIDVLSGLANRRGFQGRLDFEWMKAQQDGGKVALLMIDVDHFKLYNDSCGHPEGDACLSRIGETLAGIAERTSGLAARYGGEEFCLLVPQTDAEESLRVGEMVRAAVEELSIPHRTSAFQHVTVSVGMACISPSDALHPRDLIEAADAALYAAKHRGRNTVVQHGFIRSTDTDSPMALAG
ncbi:MULTISPECIES: diguanylate cyclase [Rhodopseudomonas]|uniref:diguanylate cyclase n=1 Tax=Rhodopseudomonas palustris TaxID=1076 RepID=A0A0D7EGI0_RHOPL|nr:MULTISPECIES: diguanylate cyclase [Rhodopseudomonas]KIZ39630.1 diguanylate cyclase [Rhodopseudomonas palustris]MDF3813640.1 diguanylate cyclase [Rhodopseudomonas sp. BAL398]WOK16449.1 diguanylate cyclase [Rhodopseudomonas sp. BAL398]